VVAHDVKHSLYRLPISLHLRPKIGLKPVYTYKSW
jgi:hypothetical protein